jgi:hypothetical protein
MESNKEEKIAKAKLNCIDELFRITGYNITHEAILDDLDWKRKYQMNTDQFNQWRDFCIDHFQSEAHLSYIDAVLETSVFVVMYGVKLIDNDFN